MPTLPHRNKNPGSNWVAAGAEKSGNWINSYVVQHIDGGKQAVC